MPEKDAGVFLCCSLLYCFEIEPLTEPEAHCFKVGCLVESSGVCPSPHLPLPVGLQVLNHAKFCVFMLDIQIGPSCFSSKFSYLLRHPQSPLIFWVLFKVMKIFICMLLYLVNHSSFYYPI